jgi:hypothetical protein
MHVGTGHKEMQQELEQGLENVFSFVHSSRPTEIWTSKILKRRRCRRSRNWRRSTGFVGA